MTLLDASVHVFHSLSKRGLQPHCVSVIELSINTLISANKSHGSHLRFDPLQLAFCAHGISIPSLQLFDDEQLCEHVMSTMMANFQPLFGNIRPARTAAEMQGCFTPPARPLPFAIHNDLFLTTTSVRMLCDLCHSRLSLALRLRPRPLCGHQPGKRPGAGVAFQSVQAFLLEIA